MTKITRRMVTATAIATVLAAGAFAVTGAALAADVKKIAIMTPDNPNDEGWNQQGDDAAKAVAEKYVLEFMPYTGLGYGDVHPAARQ